ncbi:MAG: hypothetical protein IJM90_08735 [Firmicutes bacterium]|nr:hypothetical protein [Bacillota bacterium]
MNLSLRKCLKAAAALLLALMMMAGCAEGGRAPELLEPQNAVRPTHTVRRGTIYDVRVMDGEVIPVMRTVSLDKSGTVGACHVYVGDTVRKGDLLLSLETEQLTEEAERLTAQLEQTRQSFASDLRTAELNVKIAEQELSRMQWQKASSTSILRKRQEIERLKLSYEQLQEEQAFRLEQLAQSVQKAEEALQDQELVSPADGIIVYCRQMNVGDKISEHDVLFVIASESEIEIRSDYLSAKDYNAANKVEARIGADTYQVRQHPYDQQEYLRMVLAGKTVRSYYDLIGNTGEVQAGTYAALLIYTNFKEDVLTVPRTALYHDESGRYVYVVTANGGSERRNITTGIMTSMDAEVLEGLQEGETIYVKE